jgi:hypothetical protein
MTATCILSRYSHGPGNEHHVAIKRLLAYLKGSKDLLLVIKGSVSRKCSITVYVDSDWAGDQGDRKSTTGYAIFIDKNLLSYRTIKQNIVALSSCEAEYIAFSSVVQELLWILQLFKHMRMDHDQPIIYIDNRSAIDLLKRATVSDRSKHIDVRYHNVRQHFQDGKFTVQHISTEENIADIFTKALGTEKFWKHQTSLGLEMVESKELKDREV